MLRHYRKTIKPLTDALNAVYMDIDFAEGLTVTVKYKPQSLHWAQEQVTSYSVNSTKIYHPYFSGNKVHDHVFAKIAMDEILSQVNHMNSFNTVVIESNKCTVQYISAKHFNDLQKLSNRLGKNINHLYRIARHRNCEIISH